MNSATTLQHLLHGSPSERATAAEYLAQQGPEAAYAASELTAACSDTESVSDWAVAALEELGPPPSSAIDSLVSLAQSEKPLTVYWAVTLLGRAGPDALAHQQVLVTLLQYSQDSAVQEKAAWSLGRMQATSSEATQALQQAAQSPESRLSRVAAKSLQQTQT
ncbi:MAG: HEAT repeat domain-containing protein [Rubripirellula sp.]|jgi:HEAT repeat protein